MRRPSSILPRHLPGVAVLLLSLALAGCGGSGGSGEPAAAPSSPTGSTPSAPLSGPRYVALGDSFSAAPLSSATSGGDGCLRAAKSYPYQVAAGVPDLELVDVACAGADSTSLVGVQQTVRGVVPAQFDALTPDTRLVTIGIGGNDFGLFGTLVTTCTQLAPQDPQGAPCRAKYGSGPNSLGAKIQQLDARLSAVIAGIHDRAPAATIVVVGYPRLLPDHGTCPDLLPLAAGDYPYVSSMIRRVAHIQERATRSAGVTYIDMFRPSRGHDICSDDPWVNGQTTDPLQALAYHPFQAEQDAVASRILRALPQDLTG